MLSGFFFLKKRNKNSLGWGFNGLTVLKIYKGALRLRVEDSAPLTPSQPPSDEVDLL